MLRIRAWKSRRLTERSGLGEEGSLLLIEVGGFAGFEILAEKCDCNDWLEK
jgi:hypothetical protein